MSGVRLLPRPARPPASAGGKPPPAAASPGGASRRDRLRRDLALLIMTMPGLALLLVFHYVPLLGNVVAFKDYLPYVGIVESPWVGLRNFADLFADPDFWNALWNTLEITVLQLVLFFPASIGLAILLHGILRSWLRRLIQNVVYLPHFISWVIVIALFQQTLGGAGMINSFARSHGLATFDIMTNPHLFSLLVTVEGIWKDAGWGTIIFLAALAAIDVQLYESAAVDGAGRWRQLWHVTLPGIRPVIVLLLVLRLGEALSVGFEPIILQRASVGADAAEVLDSYVYFYGVVDSNWGVAVAAGLIKGVVGFLLILTANKAAHALGEQGVYKR
ncbi:ABC transporter permease [Kribbella sp. NPDC050124]|uniref:ABC transporter permease n=1 Tax=Kribbella sp. NPDC050124 TaxID=3364114 RepID=UPI0037A9FCBC